MKAEIPEQDFIHAQYDRQEEPATKLLLILSTPRSGSTLLCEKLLKADLCLAHEYFQHFQYLPELAERWDCVGMMGVKRKKFVKALFANRSSASGYLGINLHGSHIPTFLKFYKHFPPLESVKVIHLHRLQRIKQAVSYAIASQTKKWSSHFEAVAEPTYSAKKIQRCLKRFEDQTLLNTAFATTLDAPVLDISYEELLESSTRLSRFLELPDEAFHSDGALKKQANQLNRDWVQRFAQEQLNESKS